MKEKTTSEKLKAYLDHTGMRTAHFATKILKLKRASSFSPKLKNNKWTELQKDIIESLYNKIA